MERKIYYVDLPDPNADRTGESEWKNVEICFSKREAQKLLQDVWGIGKKHSDLFITAGRTEG